MPRSPTPRRRRVPWYVPLVNPLVRSLLAAGIPLGPDVLITVRGRKTGLPRSTPVAVAAMAGRRWLVAPFGESDWVRNLRAAAGEAVLTGERRREQVSARELDGAERVRFFAEIVNPYLRTNPFARWIVRRLDGIPADPPTAAARTFVFEVRHRDG
ncbi:MAG TPA: nitroreductase family deazaflavin-dependent oxidoreductase [Candidatus Limnocylindria bacterium]|nr:nitroreductase family deazaflavin-dependent oxidoreductase [Candidatus Limnocylindria bacterium]